jgi:hypothetical protein
VHARDRPDHAPRRDDRHRLARCATGPGVPGPVLAPGTGRAASVVHRLIRRRRAGRRTATSASGTSSGPRTPTRCSSRTRCRASGTASAATR